MSEKRTVLVTGATGKQGGQVINSLLVDENFQLRALTRNPSSPAATALANKGVQIVKGDFDDKDSLATALKGAHSAFLVTMPSTNNDHNKEERDGFRFVDAAKAAKLDHLVFTSVEDAQNQTGVPHFESKFKIEEHIRASGLQHTILRPVAFMDNIPPTTLGTFGILGLFETALLGKSLKWVSTSDIGQVASIAIRKPKEYKGRIIPIAGDDINVSQLLDVYQKVYGSQPWKAWIPSIALRALPFDAQQMFKFFRERGYSTDVQAVRKEFPFVKTFEQFLKDRK